MATTPISTLKNWFVTGAKPTQLQFWGWLDSYRHRDDKIPVADVEGLNDLFTPINNHINNTNAHSILFARTKFYALGQLQVFKRLTNTNLDVIETGDLVVGIIQTSFVKALYVSGDTDLLESYNILDQLDF